MDVGTKQLMGKARGWFLADAEAGRLDAVNNAAQKALDEAREARRELANALIDMLRVEGELRTRRILLPASGGTPATIVEVVTGGAVPSVVAHGVDYVAEGEG